MRAKVTLTISRTPDRQWVFIYLYYLSIYIYLSRNMVMRAKVTLTISRTPDRQWISIYTIYPYLFIYLGIW